MRASSNPLSNLPGFGAMLRSEIHKHGDSLVTLARALKEVGTPISACQLGHWCREQRLPFRIKSHHALHSIEARYGLPHGSFMQRLFVTRRRVSSFAIKNVPTSRLQRYARHLPDNFFELPAAKQTEITAWITKNIFYSESEFRKYQLKASQGSFSLRLSPRKHHRKSANSKRVGFISSGVNENAADAPDHLVREVDSLVSFKTATLPPADSDRNGRWIATTADQKRIYLGLFFGAMVSSPSSQTAGLGISANILSVALLVFPSVWDWYLAWRERRRGFFTVWETKMMSFAKHLVARETGWLRQNEGLSSHLHVIEGLVSETDIASAQANWAAACDRLEFYAQRRIKALNAVVRIHRDSFEPIEPVLASKSPIGEYRKITKEIMLHIREGRLSDFDEAEATRSFLMLQFGMLLGLRQKNLRELLICTKPLPTSEASLTHKRRGELRWNDTDLQWEVLIPASAFKNAKSSYFFRAKPYFRVLPDVDNLYAIIAAYVERHRSTLLGAQHDPGTFFVKRRVKKQGRSEYDSLSFYDAWRQTIEKFGIYNPYTGRGAIKGLLPHGPHCVRDVLATHVVKTTGSFDLAGYAIQDTSPVIERYYGRFLPSEKVELVFMAILDAWSD